MFMTWMRSLAAVVAVVEALVVVVLGVELLDGLALADLVVQGQDGFHVSELLLPLLQDRLVIARQTDARRPELLQPLLGDLRVLGAQLRHLPELLLPLLEGFLVHLLRGSSELLQPLLSDLR